MDLLEDRIGMVMDTTADIGAGSPELQMANLLLGALESNAKTAEVMEINAGELTSPPEIFNLDEFEWFEVETVFGYIEGCVDRNVLGVGPMFQGPWVGSEAEDYSAVFGVCKDGRRPHNG